MKLTTHAKVRMQQRGIKRRIVDWLAAYGAVDHQGAGAELFFFDNRARRNLERDVGRRMIRRFEKSLDAYMICNDGAIVTVGHRYQHIVRH